MKRNRNKARLICCMHNIIALLLLFPVQDCEDPFYVVDLGRVINLYDTWMDELPQVQPFYAVKCNEDPALVKTLAALGTGFDCASKV